MDDLDPVVGNADLYKLVFENDRVRVLEYRDQPGDRTTPHAHPDSVMITLSSFQRRLLHGDEERTVELPVRPGQLAARAAALGREHRRHRDPRHVHRAQGAGVGTGSGADQAGVLGPAGVTGSSLRAHPPRIHRMSRVLSAVAWPYANGPRHIGHVAGFGVPSDVFSRYMRMAGHDVLMVSGTDEHGTPILVAADKEGVTAKDLADKNNAVIVEDLVDLGLSYDLFTRTTTGNHYNVVQEMFRTVHRNGYMIEQTTQSRDQPVDRPHPARPLHRGHLPDLRVRRGARRPVRQLRQPARRRPT